MPGDIDDYIEEIRTAAHAADGDALREVMDDLLVQVGGGDLVEDPARFLRALKRAVRAFDRPRAATLCASLVDHLAARGQAYPAKESEEILGVLRRKRYFDTMLELGDALIQTGQTTHKVRRLYAQALIDAGRLAAALDFLKVLENDCEQAGDDAELAEARGLMGRTRKQMYMDSATQPPPNPALRDSLNAAIGGYASVYDATSKIWHGINAAALIQRAQRDGIAAPARDSKEIAREILQSVSGRGGDIDLWARATGAEAHLALGDYASALEWIVEYARADGADAFEFASTLRQFEEVWQLDGENKSHAPILQVLRASLLEKEGGAVQLADVRHEIAMADTLNSNKQFEKVLGQDRYRTHRWYVTGLNRAINVAQVIDRNGNGQGTGFLLDGGNIRDELKGRPVLVTNAHVISEDPREHAGNPPALPPDDVRIRFEARDGSDEFEVEDVLFSSPRNRLDCTMVTLRGDVAIHGKFPVAKRLPLVGKRQRVYVIGHPRGGGLSYSLDDSMLLDHEVPKIHYRTPTEGGSSGSPVFNQQWDLIALHHAGGSGIPKLHGNAGTYAANEGIAISSILAAARA